MSQLEEKRMLIVRTFVLKKNTCIMRTKIRKNEEQKTERKKRSHKTVRKQNNVLLNRTSRPILPGIFRDFSHRSEEARGGRVRPGGIDT